MSGQVVSITGGQTYTATGPDTIFAGPGYEIVTMGTSGAILFDVPGSAVYATGGTLVQAAGSATIQAGSPATVFAGGASAVVFAGSEVFTTPADGATTIDGAGATVWANSNNLYFIAEGSGSFMIQFDAGSSNSTVIAGLSERVLPPGFGLPPLPPAQLFVENGGMMEALGASDATLVAGAGSTTINASHAAGTDVFLAGSGNTSLNTDLANNYVVAGSGAATVNVGSGLAALVAVNGIAGGADLVLNWTSADQVFLFGYGSNGIASEQVAGGALQLILTDQTRITLAGVTSISSAQLHFG